jgi:hypothetical protein
VTGPHNTNGNTNGEPSGSPASHLEHSEYNRVARLYSEPNPLPAKLWEAYRRDTRLKRHHPNGCQAEDPGLARRGYYIAEAPLEWLLTKEPCQRCIVMVEAR